MTIPLSGLPPGGKYEIVLGMSVDVFAREKMDATMKELVEERDIALDFLDIEKKA